MEFSTTFLVFCLLAVLSSTSTEAATSPPAPVSFSPAPAPAPTSPYVNLTDLLSVAGPFHTFLDYLQSTKVIDTFQNQANDTHQGITLFVPKDSAFSSLKKPLPSLSNVSSDQLKQIMLFHALPHYYSFADFKNLSESTGPVSTFAGAGQFGLNFTYVSGLVRIDSGWSKTKVTSSVHSTAPVAIYQVEKVLLPEAVFGTDIPPMPAPAPAPDAGLAPTADSPSADATAKGGKASAESSSAAASSSSGVMWSQLVLAVSGVIVLLL